MPPNAVRCVHSHIQRSTAALTVADRLAPWIAQLFADFETLDPPKMAKRLQLFFSQTVRCLDTYTLHLVRNPTEQFESPPSSMRWTAVQTEYEFESPADETLVHIYEVDDLYGNDPEVENACLTDGAGRISLDLMRGIPSIANGQVLVDGQRVDKSDDPDERSAPVVVQGRLWYAGSLAKGLWILDTGLPARTMLVGKDKQRKVAGRPGCVAALRGISSFEVIKTFETPVLGKLDVYLAPLLEVAAGARVAELHSLILRQQKEECMRLLRMLDSQLPKGSRTQEAKKVLEQHQRTVDGKVSVADLVKVFGDPLGEPYLAQELTKIQKAALKKLRLGKVLLPHSHLLVIAPDFTRSLREDQVAPFIRGQQLQRNIEKGLVYGPPGMHPGDVHLMSVAYPQVLLDTIAGADERRVNILFFSTQGTRSLADKIAGKDYDGDECLFIGWPELTELFERPSAPYDPKRPPHIPADKPAVGRGKRGEKRSAPTGSAPPLKAAMTAAPAAAPALTSTPAGAGGSEWRTSTSLTTATMATTLRAAPAPRRDLERRLLFNFMFARFLSSPLVGTAGTQWKVASEKGAGSDTCLALEHLYKEGLDAALPDLCSLTTGGLSKHIRRLPAALRSNCYPAHMEAAIIESEKRAAAAGKQSHITKSSEKSTSLLGQLWDAPEKLLAAHCEPAEPTVQVDRMLTRKVWPREVCARSGTPEYEDRYLEQWRSNWNEYSRREKQLKRSDPLEEDDPYWEAWRALSDEFAARLRRAHPDRVTYQVELYAEVAALYEELYEQQRRARRERESAQGGSSSRGGDEATMGASSQARIKFVWRVAGEFLMEMKRKAPEQQERMREE